MKDAQATGAPQVPGAPPRIDHPPSVCEVLYSCGYNEPYRRLPCGFLKPLSMGKVLFPQVFC